jgi:hypothetical protein
MRKPLAVLALFGALQANAPAQVLDYSKYFTPAQQPSAVLKGETYDLDFRVKMANAEMAYDAGNLEHFAEILAGALGFDYLKEEGKSARPYSMTLHELLKDASRRDPAGKRLLEHVKMSLEHIALNAMYDYYEEKLDDTSPSQINGVRSIRNYEASYDLATTKKSKRAGISEPLAAMMIWNMFAFEHMDYSQCLELLESIAASECSGKKKCKSTTVSYVKSALRGIYELK